MTFRGNDVPSFFKTQRLNNDDPSLLSTQVDPSTPSSSALSLVTDPILPDRYTKDWLRNFDPDIYDLSDNSHLMKLLSAFFGASGIGGVRRQMIIARLAGAMSSSHFLDLDSFYGPIFGLYRLSSEIIDVDPSFQTASPTQWDSYSARDAAYRSRIIEFSRALNLGPTRQGVEAIASAVLNQPVRVFETWQLQSQDTTSTGYLWSDVEQTYPTWGSIKSPYYAVAGKSPLLGASPSGNFSEAVVFASKPITEEQRHELTLVFDHIKPSGVVVTIMPGNEKSFQNSVQVNRPFEASSEYWDIITVIDPNVAIENPVSGSVYNGQDQARPAFAEYSGEKMSYVSLISSTSAYQMDGDYIVDNTDSQTVVYPGNVEITYPPGNAVTSPARIIASRMTSSGILTSYPYSGNSA